MVSLAADGTVGLTVKASAPVPQPQAELAPGRKLSPRVMLSVGEVQTLAESAPKLTKSLAGCDVQFEVAVSWKTKSGMDLTTANDLLGTIREGWRLS